MMLVAVLLILVGSVFSLLGALGLLRFPNLCARLHAAAKAGPLGVGLILLGVAFNSTELFVAARCVLGFVFLIVLSPISAHLLARTTLGAGSSAENITSIKNIDNSR